MTLPTPDTDALAQSRRLQALIETEIRRSDGWISFTRYMELALYAPRLGYYSGGATKFGVAGDFVTAPEISPLFGRTLARQAAQVMAASDAQILEAGAGSGALAAELLASLERLGAAPRRYAILELSAELRERQAQTIRQRVPSQADRVEWIDRLPERHAGLVLANEVLDAMPVHLVAWHDDAIMERGVGLDAAGRFAWQERPATGPLLDVARDLPVQAPYVSEINLAAGAWIAEWAHRLERGALLLIDYGFPRHEYYHPQRSAGTLVCHYRHHVHDDPFYLPGLNDITAHVDFTALAESGHAAGLRVLGYTSQAGFLLNCGLTQELAAQPADAVQQARLAAGVQKLISPSEMGELFKVMALGRDVPPLLGFQRGDRTHAL